MDSGKEKINKILAALSLQPEEEKDLHSIYAALNISLLLEKLQNYPDLKATLTSDEETGLGLISQRMESDEVLQKIWMDSYLESLEKFMSILQQDVSEEQYQNVLKVLEEN